MITVLGHVQIKDLGVKAGVVLNPATPLESIQHVLGQVDLILLMSGEPLLHSCYGISVGAALHLTTIFIFGPCARRRAKLTFKQYSSLTPCARCINLS